MKILLGMSGGLDSTYAAHFLSEQGHTVEGALLIMHGYTDRAAAIRSAEECNIPLHIIDCREEFENKVVSDFVSEYASGRTPNPCVVCNREIKIASLCRYARENSFDAVSTGHYSYVECENGRYFVRRAGDARKDQSYVLWGLTQDMLGMMYLPLASMSKPEIREKAVGLGLSSARAGESQEICFIPDGDYSSFIINRGYSFPEGEFIDESGKCVGIHKGTVHYTIGQRKRLGIALGKPAFVCKIDRESNKVFVSTDESLLYSDTVNVSKLNFQYICPPDSLQSGRFLVKVRYAARPVEANVTFDKEYAKAVFTDKVRAPAPGQSCVFYDGDKVAFGGIISG